MFYTKFFYSGRYISLTKNISFAAGGKHLTSPRSKMQPQLKSFHEEKSPKMRMINGQSTESLESLSDELASNSGGNNSNTELSNRRGGRVSGLTGIQRLTENNYLYHFRETSFTVIKDVVHCMIVRRTTKMSLHLKKAILSSSWPRRPRTITGWRASWSQPQTSEAYFPPRLSTC